MLKWKLVLSRSAWLAMLCIIVSTAGALADEPSSGSDPATQSALRVLNKCTQLRRGQSPDTLLAALRQMGDPQMIPIFKHLANESHPVFQVHGLVGMAELAPDQGVDLTVLGKIADSSIQAEVVAVLLDLQLLTDDQALTLVQDDRTHIGVKLVVATNLIKRGQLTDHPFLRETLYDDKLGRQGLAALLLLQGGDDQAAQQLEAITVSDSPGRDQVLAMLVGTARRNHLDRAAAWVTRLCTDPDTHPTVAQLAIQTALFFGQPEAYELWKQRYEQVTQLPDQMRLSLWALSTASAMKPHWYDPMSASEQPVIRQMGLAGTSIASGDDSGQAVIDLIAVGHPIVNQWLLDYAQRDNVEQASKRAILAGFLNTFNPNRPDLKNAVNEVAMATQLMLKTDAQAATDLLRPILLDPSTDKLLVRGILDGLLRARSQDHPYRAVAELAPFADARANHLVVLILAKHSQPLTPNQADDLALLVRGGGGFQDPLRVQAAWAYLKRTGQIDSAINAIVAP